MSWLVVSFWDGLVVERERSKGCQYLNDMLDEVKAQATSGADRIEVTPERED